MTKENVSAVVKKARDAYKEWMKDLEKRIDSLYHVAQELRKNKENLSIPHCMVALAGFNTIVFPAINEGAANLNACQ